jgi:hypothetical protein
MSGYNDSRLLARGIAEAQVSLIFKPFKPEELSDKVKELMASAPPPVPA